MNENFHVFFRNYEIVLFHKIHVGVYVFISECANGFWVCLISFQQKYWLSTFSSSFPLTFSVQWVVFFKSFYRTDLINGLAQFQVRRLAMEVRQLASSRQITVLNGNSTQSQYRVFV